MGILNMSKIPTEKMEGCMTQMLANRKERKFVESVDLQIGLKDYDPSKDKRFAGSVKLAHVPRPRLKVCMIADANHMDKCKAHGIDCIDADTLKKKIDPSEKKKKKKNPPKKKKKKKKKKK